MKAVIKEYAGAVVAVLSTGLFLSVMGCVLFHKDGMLSYVIEKILEGGV